MLLAMSLQRRSARAGSRYCRVGDSLKGRLRLLKTSSVEEPFRFRRKADMRAQSASEFSGLQQNSYAMDRKFLEAYQGKFFKEQGIFSSK
jgi:hypothetical protein